MGKSWLCAANFSSAWHTGLSGGAPDSVRCPRLADIEPAALGNQRSCTAINHRTIRWCTELSGESSATNSSVTGNEKGDVAIIHRTVRWCTGLSGEPTEPAANSRPRDQRATCGQLQRSAGCTGLFGVHQTVFGVHQTVFDVHRTVSGVPTSPEEQRSNAPDMEGDRAPDNYRACPVVHRTVRCTTREKARNAFQNDLQRLLAALGL
jgi:hypothetical protein